VFEKGYLNSVCHRGKLKIFGTGGNYRFFLAILDNYTV
jgi:hypothetical protein